MEAPPPLDYEPRPAAAPAGSFWLTGAAIALVVAGWVLADIPHMFEFMQATNAAAGGVAILGLCRPRRTTGERIVLYIVLAMAIVALTTFI